MKEKLNILLFYVVVAILPYIIVSVMHGFNFNMSTWGFTTAMHYSVSVVVLFILFLYHKLDL